MIIAKSACDCQQFWGIIIHPLLHGDYILFNIIYTFILNIFIKLTVSNIHLRQSFTWPHTYKIPKERENGWKLRMLNHVQEEEQWI